MKERLGSRACVSLLRGPPRTCNFDKECAGAAARECYPLWPAGSGQFHCCLWCPASLPTAGGVRGVGGGECCSFQGSGS